jgi:drug/metabolite transporter (DMT)-like permease
VGFIGIIISIPTTKTGDIIGYLFCLLSAICYSFLNVSGRFLSVKESTQTLVFGFNLSIGVLSTILLPFVWQAITIYLIVFFLSLSVVTLFSHLLVIEAYKKCEIKILMPIEYSIVVWTILLGYLCWDEIPTKQSLFGALIIIVCGILVVFRTDQRNNMEGDNEK